MDRCNANIEQGKANVTSLVERRSRYTFVMRNANRNSAGAIAGIESKLSALPSALREIITFDRGTEWPRVQRLLVDQRRRIVLPGE